MNGKIVMDCIDAAYASIKEHAEEIMVLDQSIGDGDHVFNLIRGLEALRSIRGDIETLEAGPALKLAANKVLSTVGGSSGPLFSSLLMGMSRASEHLNGDPPGYAQMYAAGVKAVQDRGKTGRGSKTMMDVLIPVAERLNELVAQSPVPQILAELPKEANRGMLATCDCSPPPAAKTISRRTHAASPRSRRSPAPRRRSASRSRGRAGRLLGPANARSDISIRVQGRANS